MPLPPDSHQLARALSDLRFSAEDDVCLVCRPPARWDELLDTELPLLVHHTAGEWEQLGAALWEAGLSQDRVLRLAEADGRVKEVCYQDQQLTPHPEGSDWALAINWSHPEEGWRSRLPLFGRHYLITRAAEQAQSLLLRLQELGARATVAPTIEFTQPDDLAPWTEALKGMPDFHWLVFTSPNGVRYFLERLAQSEHDLRAIRGKIACIGPSTARTLAQSGLKADLVPDQYVAEDLLRALGEQLRPGDRVLVPRAQVAREVLPEGLKELGTEVLVAPVYKTVKPGFDLENVPPGARVLFTSSSTVKNWVALAPEARLPCFCIGPVTAGTAQEQGLRILGVAEQFTIDGLVDCLLRLDG